MNVTNLLFRAARAAAWSRAIGKAASGHPAALVRRVRNRYIMSKIVGPILRK